MRRPNTYDGAVPSLARARPAFIAETVSLHVVTLPTKPEGIVRKQSY